MDFTLAGMAALFGIGLFTGLTGLVFLPAVWQLVFASLAGLSGLGLGITGYAINRC